MKRLLLIACVLSCTLLSQAKDWTQYVNPLMGSQSTFELSTGNTYPAIARPWGSSCLSPAFNGSMLFFRSQSGLSIASKVTFMSLLCKY